LGNNSLKLGNDMFFSDVCKIMVRQATVLFNFFMLNYK
jgi:hypothetical protein